MAFGQLANAGFSAGFNAGLMWFGGGLEFGGGGGTAAFENGAASGIAELTEGLATGWRSHALDQMWGRGLSLFDVVDAIKKGVAGNMEMDELGQWSQLFYGADATVALDPAGEVITVMLPGASW